MKVDYTPGESVVVYYFFCGWCNDDFDEGPHVGVIGGKVDNADAHEADGPAPQYYIRQLTCPQCKDVDPGITGRGVIYSHKSIFTVADAALFGVA